MRNKLLLLFLLAVAHTGIAQRFERPRLKKEVTIDTLQVLLRFDAVTPDSLQTLFRQSFKKATERFYRRRHSFVITTDSFSQHPSLTMELGALRYPRKAGNYLALALNVAQLAAHIYWFQNADSWFPVFLFLHPNTSAWLSMSSESGVLRAPHRNAQVGDLVLRNAWFAGKERQHRRFAHEMEWTYFQYLRAFHRQNQRHKNRPHN